MLYSGVYSLCDGYYTNHATRPIDVWWVDTTEDIGAILGRKSRKVSQDKHTFQELPEFFSTFSNM